MSLKPGVGAAGAKPSRVQLLDGEAEGEVGP
jgi:hypothetical protein